MTLTDISQEVCGVAVRYLTESIGWGSGRHRSRRAQRAAGASSPSCPAAMFSEQATTNRARAMKLANLMPNRIPTELLPRGNAAPTTRRPPATKPRTAIHRQSAPVVHISHEAVSARRAAGTPIVAIDTESAEAPHPRPGEWKAVVAVHVVVHARRPLLDHRAVHVRADPQHGYGVQVAAVTSQGVGTFSSLSNLVTPLGVASAPGDVAATAGAGSATVTCGHRHKRYRDRAHSRHDIYVHNRSRHRHPGATR